MKKWIAFILALALGLCSATALAGGWVNSDGRWWYSYDDGGYAHNQWLNDGGWYYFDGDGWMVTGWLQSGGSWYYLGSSGMSTGWKNISGSWYYFDGSGAMVTGWQEIGGSWYYFSASGAMKTGWQEIDGTWYYFGGSGAMTAGWEQVDGKWYHFAGSGKMSTGWEESGGSWYYFTAGGEMATGWQQVGSVWYFFNDDGKMRTGWLDLGEHKYYFDANGAMVTGEVLIDGVLQLFDTATGQYLGEATQPIKLIVWSFTPELEDMIKKYYAANHPEIEFEFGYWDTDQGYTGKLDDAMGDPESAVGEDAPDVFALEASFVKKYVESDMTGDLKAIGFTDEELSVAFPVVAQIGQNEEGVQKALSWQSTPGVLMFRADLAEKYLGVTTPEEMQEKVKDWDSFLATARELNEKSEGACKIVTGIADIWNPYQYQRDQGWVVDDTLVVDKQLRNFETLSRTLTKEGLTWDGDGTFTDEWFEGMDGTRETLCYFLPTWGLHYSLKPHSSVGAEQAAEEGKELTEEELKKASEETNGTYGDWRITDGPVAYSWGGTWLATNAKKLAEASSAVKEAVHDLVRTITLDDDFLVRYAEDTGDFVSSTTAVEKIIENGGTPNPFLGGQDHYSIFANAAALADGTLMSEYDDELSDLWDKLVTAPYTSGEKKLNECINEFKAAVSQNYPDLKVK